MGDATHMPVQAEFGVGRSDASLPYTLTMIGFGLGGILMGKLSDRFGVIVPVWIGTFCLGLGFVAAGFNPQVPGSSPGRGANRKEEPGISPRLATPRR